MLNYDAKKAKDLWAQADAISKWSGTFSLAYNADGGHQAWVDAVCNSIKNTLGIDAQGQPYPTFAALRKDITDRTIKGAFRSGWQADYPGLYDFIQPLYFTEGQLERRRLLQPGDGQEDRRGRLGEARSTSRTSC